MKSASQVIVILLSGLVGKLYADMQYCSDRTSALFIDRDRPMLSLTLLSFRRWDGVEG